MKYITCTLPFIMIGIIAYPRLLNKNGHTYCLKGKILNQENVNAINLTPLCGIAAFATVVEFKIIELSDSSYNLPNIAVIFTCPAGSLTNSFFDLEVVYELEVSDYKQEESMWSMMNQEVLDKYPKMPKLWVKEINRIE